MLDMLFHTRHQRPFLIVAPMSTLPHWERELQGWTHLHYSVYHGSKEERDMLRRSELQVRGCVGFPARLLLNCMCLRRFQQGACLH